MLLQTFKCSEMAMIPSVYVYSTKFLVLFLMTPVILSVPMIIDCWLLRDWLLQFQISIIVLTFFERHGV